MARKTLSVKDLQLLFKEASEGDGAHQGAAAVMSTSACGPAQAGGSSAGTAAAAAAGDTHPLPQGLPQHHGLQPPTGLGSQDQAGTSHRMRRLGSSRASSGSLRGGGGLGSAGSGDAGWDPAGPRQPLQEYGERVSTQLKRWSLEARATLEALQAPMVGPAGSHHKPWLPSSALHFCQGLAFVRQRKAGLVCGWTWGTALLIQRLPGGAWSAPLFLRLRFASLGLTCGAQSIRAIYVLQTPEQVAAFLRGSGPISLDAALPGELNPLDVYAPISPVKHQDLSAKPNATRPQCAMITEGLIWDVSLRVGFTLLDRKLNSQLYGAAMGAQPSAVLAGCVPVPPELQLLYRDVEIRAAEAQIVRPTVSKFEMARWQAAQFADWSNRGLERSTRGPRAPLQQRGSSSSSLEGPSRRGSAYLGATSLGPSYSPGGSSSGLQAGGRQAESPCTTLAAASTAPDGTFKLFGDVEDIGFEQQELHEWEEAEQQQQQQVA